MVILAKSVSVEWWRQKPDDSGATDGSRQSGVGKCRGLTGLLRHFLFSVLKGDLECVSVLN